MTERPESLSDLPPKPEAGKPTATRSEVNPRGDERGEEESPPTEDPENTRQRIEAVTATLAAESPAGTESSKDNPLEIIATYENLRKMGKPIHEMPRVITDFLAKELKIYTTETPRRPTLEGIRTETELDKLNAATLLVLGNLDVPEQEGVKFRDLSKTEVAKLLFDAFSTVSHVHLESVRFEADKKRKDGGVAKADKIFLTVPDEASADFLSKIFQALHRSKIEDETRGIGANKNTNGNGYIIDIPNPTEYTNRIIRAAMDTFAADAVSALVYGDQQEDGAQDGSKKKRRIFFPKRKKSLRSWDEDKPEKNETFSPKTKEFLTEQNQKYKNIKVTVTYPGSKDKKEINSPDQRLPGQLEHVTQCIADALGVVIPKKRRECGLFRKPKYGNLDHDPEGIRLLIEEIYRVTLQRVEATTEEELKEGPTPDGTPNILQSQLNQLDTAIREFKKHKIRGAARAIMLFTKTAVTLGVDTATEVATNRIDELLKNHKKYKRKEGRFEQRRNERKESLTAHHQIDLLVAQKKRELTRNTS